MTKTDERDVECGQTSPENRATSRASTRRRKRRAFTLVELLLVLAILVILGSMVGVYFSRISDKGNMGAAKIQINNFKDLLKFYHVDMGYYPSSSQGLGALWEQPGDENSGKWNGPYSESAIPVDPWGNEYLYELDGDKFIITSMGPDRIEGTEDDITNE